MNLTSGSDCLVLPSIKREALATSSVARAALEGLTCRPKYLPSWLFYDQEGSRLFESIMRLPEYYLTRLEHSIFTQHASSIVAAAAGDEHLSVVELGAGSASKTLLLLRALVARQGSAVYLPVDVSESALDGARRNIQEQLPQVEVQPICSEFTQEKCLGLSPEGRRLALYIGSSIGNFDTEDAVDLLRWLRSQLQPADAILLGTDMVKPVKPLLAAYNDKAGVTAAFNKNILARLNRELGADFSLSMFDHRAIWNPVAGRMEMHLDSAAEQTVLIEALDRSFHLQRGESIHTENSYKFTPDGVEDLLMRAGFALEQSWYDADRWYGVHLARVVDNLVMPEDDASEEAA